jgi:hypothetical protein
MINNSPDIIKILTSVIVFDIVNNKCCLEGYPRKKHFSALPIETAVFGVFYETHMLDPFNVVVYKQFILKL